MSGATGRPRGGEVVRGGCPGKRLSHLQVWSWKGAKGIESRVSQRPALWGETGEGQAVWDWDKVHGGQLGKAGQK